ncbi:MAG TPA: plastocyanin/azurin family copper-binding protein [Solirubrobacteraceae bacterium]|jgi:plastocyanin|nr:plastocyanin/azurin family copper-binding protein [Solirubrobacteraceae bacterium]
MRRTNLSTATDPSANAALALAPAARRARVRRLIVRSSALGALAAVALVTAGCSVKGEDDANLISGKKAFVAKCGSCHTLARAETKGVVGPNLDEAFRTSLKEGADRSTVRGVVEKQIQIPNPEGAMPKNLVSGSTAKDVASYIAQSVDKSGKDTGLLASAVKAPGSGKPAEEKGGKLSIAANAQGQLAYETNKATATAGSVTIEMPNMSGVSHNIAIETGEGGASAKGSKIGASEFTTKTTAKVSVSLKSGTYTFFCEAPGHRAAGMYGTLTVK